LLDAGTVPALRNYGKDTRIILEPQGRGYRNRREKQYFVAGLLIASFIFMPYLLPGFALGDKAKTQDVTVTGKVIEGVVVASQCFRIFRDQTWLLRQPRPLWAS
jgi:hypothetical protein